MCIRITKKEYVANKPDKEYVKYPNADPEYLDSFYFQKSVDEDGNIVFVPTHRKTRHYTDPIKFLIDTIRKERDEFIENYKNKKNKGKTSK